MSRFRHQQGLTSPNYLIKVIVTLIFLFVHLFLIASSNYFPFFLLDERYLMVLRFRVVGDVTLIIILLCDRKSLLS
jgi:hypothetical protein